MPKYVVPYTFEVKGSVLIEAESREAVWEQFKKKSHEDLLEEANETEIHVDPEEIEEVKDG